MERIEKNTDGSYSWHCQIDQDFHRRDTRKGLYGVFVIFAVILFIYVFAPSPHGNKKELWVILVPIGVVLLIALPLLYLQYNASDPHEQYMMNGEYVKTGYGKSSVFTCFSKVKYVEITPRYIELYDGLKRNRIYVPKEDRDWVQEFVFERIPKGVAIRRG